MRLDQLIRSSGIFDHELIVQDAERRQLFVERCAGRSVLHVGCCDVPLFNADDNLHLFLARHTEHLDGLDVSEEGIAVLRRYVKGDFFVDPSTVTKEYEVLLAPEVLEHTPNPSEFLKGIFSIRARQYIITAPHYQWFEQARRNGNVFHERVHSDHKAWYSPYTLLNAVRPFIDEARDDVELFLLTGTGSVAVVGAEETYPSIYRLDRLASLLGFPYIPITPFFPFLGPLGALPIPVQIEGSLFFDITHATGQKPGPATLRQYAPTIWEVHPLSKIVFEPKP